MKTLRQICISFGAVTALVISALAIPAEAASQRAVRTTPITPGASPQVRALLAQFYSRVTRSVDRVAIGQQLLSYEYTARSDPNGWYGAWLKLQQRHLPLPEIMAAETSDLESYPGFYPNQAALNELIRHGRAGHIVSLVWHPDPPVGNDFSTPLSTTVLQQAINDATPAGRRWQIQLDRAAAVLRKFQAAGVPVLFRPLHEQNGDFFWWGNDHSTGAALLARKQAWVRLWRDMVTELTVRKGLKNLIFVFDTNQVNYDGVVPPLTFYPGPDWTDMVGIDIYDEELDLAGNQRGLQHYNALVSTGKPFGIFEFGQSTGDNGTGPNGAAWDARTLTRRIRDSYPRTVLAIAWYSTPGYVYALPDVSFTPQLLADPLIDTQ